MILTRNDPRPPLGTAGLYHDEVTMNDRPTLTDDEIRRRIECAPLLGEPAATEVRALAAEVLTLRARVAELEGEIARHDADQPDGWAALTPDGMEWFGTRTDAEGHVLDWFHDHLQTEGEGHDDPGYVLRVVAHTVEVVAATAEDDSEDGEWCRERGVDYMISGYGLRPGSGIAEVPDAD